MSKQPSLTAADEALAAREAQLRFVMDHVPLPIVHCDAETRYTFVNAPYAQRFGLRPEQVVGKRIPEVLGTGAFEAIRCHVEAALRGERVEFEEQGRFGAGGPTWIHCVYVPQYDARGAISGFVAVVQDITARKQAEAALRQSEERFSKAFGASPDGLIIARRRDGVILEVNDTLLSFFGLQRDEVIGRRSNELNLFVDGQETEGPLRNCEVKICSRLGEVRTGLISVEALDLAGEPALLTIVRDISERKKMLEALRKSESRFRGLMEQAPFSVQVLSPDGRTVQVNRAWCELWGATLDQLANYNMLEDPQLEAKGTLSQLRRAFAGEAVALPEIEYNPNETLPNVSRHEDALRYVAAVAYPLKDDTGQVREVVLVHEDITARRRAEKGLRESEEKLRLLADTIPQLAWIARPDGHIFWYNRRWYDYTGTTPEQMEGWGWKTVHDPKVLPEVLLRWQASIENGDPFDMVMPLRGADGQFRPFLSRVNPLRDAGGHILYWFGTNTDISEIKRMEEALREDDRRKDEFIATLAHELRNPLAPIANSLQILKMPQVDPLTLERSRETMERQVHQLTRLVDDLLDVSRVVSGKIDLRKTSVPLSDVLARALETAQPLIDMHRHELCISLPEEELSIDADPVRLAQAIGNLLANSAKYTQPEGRIVVSARREGHEAVVQVQDNGIGIAPNVLPHVFKLFVQGDHTAARAHGGLGVGLTLAKNLVEMHAGRIEAHSSGSDKGSTFTVRLPISAGTCENRAVPPDTGQAFSKYQRVLVVDDNKDAAESLAALLRLQKHQVRVAYDGASALEIAHAYRPDIIFLDIGMPGMDGFEVARRIRETPGMRNTVLAALTGWGQTDDRRRSADAGFDHHLVKPADPKVLGALLSRPHESNF